VCGISGVFSVKDREGQVMKMSDALRHRGPDDASVANLPARHGTRCGIFAHRRLAIIDLSEGGRQPKFSAEGHLCISFNGEIYNYADLRRDLERRNIKFSSASDTEVILAGWEADGAEFLRRLRGMFAIAIWDRRTETGYLIRDTFGIKPLYFAQRNGEVLFASEVRALLATGLIPPKTSSSGVRSYLATGSVAEPDTIIQGISAVPPGCVTAVRRVGDRFEPDAPNRFSSALESGEAEPASNGSMALRIRAALEESVGYHLVSDVPVAVFLSGGIDSSAVAGIASRISGTRLQSFTVVFDETDFSEATQAKAAARRFGTDHHEVSLSGKNLLDSLPDVFSAMDQPSLDGLNTFVVSRAVRSYGLKVVLSGLGGDELFGGYPSFGRAQALEPFWNIPRSVRNFGARGLESLGDIRLAKLGAMLKDSRPSHAAYTASRSLFAERTVDRLVRGSKGTAPRREGLEDDALVDSMSLAQQVSYYELTGYMRNTLLRDSDVFSMAHGLEIRVPLVDTGVAAVARHATVNLKFSRGALKPLLIEAVRDLLDERQVTARKMGFTLPFEAWMRREMFDEVNSVLGPSARESGLLRSSEVNRIWKAFQMRKPGVTWSRPWALYTLLRWSDQNSVRYDDVDGDAATFFELAG
jgi:asparagine synthase (glutamine-hydrolysing)